MANAYGDTIILLLMGGFMLSTAIEKSGAHRRLALGMVKMTGADSKQSGSGSLKAIDGGSAQGKGGASKDPQAKGAPAKDASKDGQS